MKADITGKPCSTTFQKLRLASRRGNAVRRIISLKNHSLLEKGLLPVEDNLLSSVPAKLSHLTH